MDIQKPKPRHVVQTSRRCSYCFAEKPIGEFSYEHIWPDALGGDYLPAPWTTNDVCARCNSVSGVFVDGEFIKSWFGSAERATGADAFLDPTPPWTRTVPLHYMGPFEHSNLEADETAEMWLGPCGAHVVHIHSKAEPTFETYAGGKPGKRKGEWGHAFIALTSSEPFWIATALLSFHRHFRKATRTVVNMSCPQGFSPPFSEVDPSNAEQVRMLDIARAPGDAARRGEQLAIRFAVKVDLGSRFLAKVALGVGRELFGAPFLDTPYAGTLRSTMWERDPAERTKLPVLGTGYLGGGPADPRMSVIGWPGGWSLILWPTLTELALAIQTPSGRMMVVQITDDAQLLTGLNPKYADGAVFVTVPGLGRAIGPVSVPAFLAHKLGTILIADLTALEAERRDSTSLPPCR